MAAVLVGFWATASGCGGDTTSSSDAKPVPFDDVLQRVTELTCRRIFECCTPAQIMSQGALVGAGPFTDEAGCRAAYENALTPSLDLVRSSMQAGRVTYRGDIAGNCFAQAASLSCADLDSVRPSCDYFVPAVQAGGACASSLDCVSGHCSVTVPSGSTASGVCAPSGALGSACVNGACNFGTVCDSSSQMCVTRKANGAPCMLSSECEGRRCTNGVCATTPFCG